MRWEGKRELTFNIFATFLITSDALVQDQDVHSSLLLVLFDLFIFLVFIQQQESFYTFFRNIDIKVYSSWVSDVVHEDCVTLDWM